MSKLLLSSGDGIRQYIHHNNCDPGKVSLETEFDAQPVIDFAAHMRARTEAVSIGKRRMPGCKLLGIVPRAMYFDPSRRMWQWTDAEWHKFWADPENRLLAVEPDTVRR